MKRILLAFFLLLILLSSFQISYADEPLKYYSNNLFEYGSKYFITEGTGKIVSSNSSIARVSGNTVSITGTGSFTLTITYNGESKTLKCFAWNVCLNNNTCKTYTDSSKSKESEPLYSKTYLAVSSSGSVFKVNDYLCTTGSYKGDLKGKYIANDTKSDNAKNFVFNLSGSNETYESTYKDLGFKVEAESQEVVTKPITQNKSITVQYRKYSTENDEGVMISGITDVKKLITGATTIRRDKNTDVIKQNYEYIGVSIDGGEISESSVISAEVDLANEYVTFWYREMDAIPEKIAHIDLSQLNTNNSSQNSIVDISNLKQLTAEQAGKIIANCAYEEVTKHKNEWTYSHGLNGEYGKTDGVHNSSWGKNCMYNQKTYQKKKSSGWAYGISYLYNGPHHYFTNKYCTNCEGFCNTMVHWALGIGKSTYTYFTHDYFYKVSKTPKYLTAAYAKLKLKPGDIILYDGHLALYIGDGKVAESNLWGIKIRSATRTDKRLISVFRISEATASKVDVTKIKTEYLKGIVSGI